MSRMRGLRRAVASAWAHRLPGVLAVGLVLLGVVGTAVRLDAPGDGSFLPFGSSTWRSGAVVVEVPAPSPDGLQPGDEVTAIAGARLADGLGEVSQPALGDVVPYELADGTVRAVRVARPAPGPLLAEGWGDLVFVLALGALAVALALRRPGEPATTPLLLSAAGLFGSTLTVVAGLPALALATGGPPLWLYFANTVGAYSIAWGAVLALAFLLAPDHPWLGRHRRRVLAVAYAGPPAAMALWAARVPGGVDSPVRHVRLPRPGRIVAPP